MSALVLACCVLSIPTGHRHERAALKIGRNSVAARRADDICADPNWLILQGGPSHAQCMGARTLPRAEFRMVYIRHAAEAGRGKAGLVHGFFCLVDSTAFAPRVAGAAGTALSFLGLRTSLLLLA